MIYTLYTTSRYVSVTLHHDRCNSVGLKSRNVTFSYCYTRKAVLWVHGRVPWGTVTIASKEPAVSIFRIRRDQPTKPHNVTHQKSIM